MNRAIATHRLRPVVDSSFPLKAAAEAFALMERGGHFGKIVVSLAT
jgi:NADPH:quinone reductase-like Zn-dependent oxidoreductase